MQTVAQATKRSASSAPKPSNQDLRSWVDALRGAGELQEINGAEREVEIGGIVDLYMRKMGNKAVLFDDIPGFPRGHRILANILTSVRRINITLGLDADAGPNELIQYWRRHMKHARAIAPVTVQNGPVMDSVRTGTDIDIFE